MNIYRAIKYFLFGLRNEDLNFDNLFFLIKFKIKRLYDKEQKKKYSDKKMLQCYKICTKLCQQIIFMDNLEQKQKRTELLFKIITLYSSNCSF